MNCKMNWRWLTSISAWAMLAAGTAVAMPTAWELKGHLTALDSPASLPADYVVGAPFAVLVSFDTDGETYSSAASGSGYRYNYTGNTLGWRISLGTTCSPCTPPMNPSASGIILRDNALDPALGTTVDGYAFYGVTTNGVTLLAIMRGPVLDLVSGPGLAAVPDPRLAGLATARFQYCAPDGSCATGAIESVANPVLGTTYALTARNCQSIDSTTTSADPYPRDCIYVDVSGNRRLGRGRYVVAGGGLGSGEIAGLTINFDSSFDPSIASPLGSAFGAITFNGPAGMPAVKASALPTEIARNNSNLLGYQLYRYAGPATPLPLVVDLSYAIADNSTDIQATGEIGLRPGGAQVSSTIAIVDGTIPMPALNANINSLTCGAEPGLAMPNGSPWPAGAILGAAVFDSPAGQINPGAATTLTVTGCADPSQPVQLAANQSFIVATSIQTPARGRWSIGDWASANGYVDASHTLRVTFDPNAAPALVQQLADGITPQCSNCSAPEVQTVAVDVRPGSTGCINRTSNGAIPVAILGSAAFNVRTIRQDGSLTLGSLALRVRSGKPLCSISQVNGDGYEDLVCQFDNVATNWTSGQTTATVSGKLYDGLPFQGNDTICVK